MKLLRIQSVLIGYCSVVYNSKSLSTFHKYFYSMEIEFTNSTHDSIASGQLFYV